MLIVTKGTDVINALRDFVEIVVKNVLLVSKEMAVNTALRGSRVKVARNVLIGSRETVARNVLLVSKVTNVRNVQWATTEMIVVMVIVLSLDSKDMALTLTLL